MVLGGERARLCFNTKAGVKPGEGWLGKFKTENHQGAVEYVGQSFKHIKHRPQLHFAAVYWLNNANDVI